MSYLNIPLYSIRLDLSLLLDPEARISCSYDSVIPNKSILQIEGNVLSTKRKKKKNFKKQRTPANIGDSMVLITDVLNIKNEEILIPPH